MKKISEVPKKTPTPEGIDSSYIDKYDPFEHFSNMLPILTIVLLYKGSCSPEELVARYRSTQLFPECIELDTAIGVSEESCKVLFFKMFLSYTQIRTWFDVQ